MALQNFHLSPLYVQIEGWYKLSGVEGERGNFSLVSGLVVFVCCSDADKETIGKKWLNLSAAGECYQRALPRRSRFLILPSHRECVLRTPGDGKRPLVRAQHCNGRPVQRERQSCLQPGYVGWGLAGCLGAPVELIAKLCA